MSRHARATEPVAAATSAGTPTGRLSAVSSVIADIGLPLAGYYTLHLLGASDWLALLAATAGAGLRLLGAQPMTLAAAQMSKPAQAHELGELYRRVPAARRTPELAVLLPASARTRIGG